MQKADGEIYQCAMEEYVGVFVRLWQAIGKPVDAERLSIYQRELSDIPLGLLEQAVSRVIRENRYNNIPTVGELWAAVRVELGNPPDIMRAIDAWIERRWIGCMHRFEPDHEVVSVETEMVG